MKYLGLLLGLLVVGVFIFKSDGESVSSQPTEAHEPDSISESAQRATLMEASTSESSSSQLVLSQNLDLAQDRINASLQSISDLESCYSERKCSDYEGGSPSHYYYEISMAMKWQLMQLTETLKHHPERQTHEMEVFAQQVLQHPEDHVKEVALDLIDLFPRTSENLAIIISSVGKSRSGALYEKSLEVLKPYSQSQEGNAQLTSFLIEKITSGGAPVSLAVAREVYPFLNDKNYHKFENSLERLRSSSKPHRTLKAQLTQYRFLHP